MRINPVKKALAEGKFQYGTNFGQLRSQEVVKILAKAGFHWAFVDTEHGGFSIETIQEICRISPFYNFTPIIRVSELSYSLITRALDVGAPGVMFPRVEVPEVLEKAISWTKFPPRGIRGYGLTPINLDFEPVTIPQVMEHMNAETLVVLQIETKRAVEAREELLSIPGVDIVMVGPVDLSISLGVPGEFMHPKMIEAMEAIRDTCIAKGIYPGTQTRLIEQARFWKKNGMKFLGNSAEVAMMFDRAKEIIAELEKAE